jgi:hypothetical protein
MRIPARAILSTLAVAASVTAARPARADVVLVKDGTPASVLVLPETAHADEELAAQELQAHVKTMAGAELRIVRGEATSDLTPVLVGLALAPDADAAIRRRSEDPAAFRLSVTAKGVSLAGLSPEGTLFAAYELLETLGVRWYMPGDLGTIIPKARTITLPEGTTIRAPSFPSRHLQTVSQRLPWYRRQRLGGSRFPGGHGIRLLPRADPKTEPELFALVDGKRTRQLCVSNPDVVTRATAYATHYFDTHPDAPWIGMGPRDGGGFCECKNCRALDSGEVDPYAAERSVTDRYIWLFNQILNTVHKKHPGKTIGFYAYHTYKLPPRKHKPNSHIVPALAPITLCRLHGMSNPICPDRSFYRTLMVEWGKVVPEVFERGYYFNLACPSLQFSKVHAIRDETRVAYKAGVKGWRVECQPSWINDTPALYVAARLMWDVDRDVDQLLGEFYQSFFGPAAEPMGAYLTLIDHAFRDTDCHTGGSFCMPQVFTRERMQRGRQLLDAAAETAPENSAFAQRIRLYRLNYDRLDAFRHMLDARNRFDFVTAQRELDRLYDLTHALLDFRLYPNPSKEAPLGGKYGGALDRQARPLWWRSSVSYINRFWAPATKSGHERTVVRGELAAGCPDQWDFLTDPNDVGEAAGWFRDGAIGGNWQTIRTTSASWSDQGLHYYKGIAWYRTQVEIPARFDGRQLYLWFGGIDEAATVWLNGKRLGTSADPGHGLPGMAGTFKPFELEATDAVRFGRLNTLAVKITNLKLNEIGTGGIVAPVLFWSPKKR